MNSLTGAWQQGGRALKTFVPQDAMAFLVSLVVHLVLLVAFGLIPLRPDERRMMVLDATPLAPVEEFELPQEFLATDFPTDAIGANSMDGAEALLSMAPELAEVSELRNPIEFLESDIGEIQLTRTLELTTGLHFNENFAIKGAAGEGVKGADGAIDRITQEIMLSLQERKTLVIWLLDQSPSLAKQHKQIYQRLERIYTELGVIEAAGNPAFAKHSNKPLLTSVYWFGENVQPVLKKPTDNIEEIKQAVSNIQLDESGTEKVFSAIYLAGREAVSYRTPNERTGEPDRNVLMVVFTDEAGEDQDGLEATVRLCRRYAMPVYVVGAPAPFGRKETYLKFVDPDPQYDQSVRWGVVEQGPETLLPERLKIVSNELPEDESPIDSGFGPYALTRLCYETGGIYFTVHPNRNTTRAVSRGETELFAAHIKHFFDPEVMRRYRPDYVSVEEYQRRVASNKARASLVTAAQLSWVQTAEPPNLRFVKTDEAAFNSALSEAQKSAALLEPQLQQLFDVLKQGEGDREQEASPRWQAGYDLAMGRLLAHKVRTEAYNAMLAKAKRGMRFAGEKNNTWVLKPADDLSVVGSQLEKQAEKARYYLERVREQHPGTPWAFLAEQELKTPLGWNWVEEFTDLSPPPRVAANPGNNNPPAAARDDEARRLQPAKPVREFKKL